MADFKDVAEHGYVPPGTPTWEGKDDRPEEKEQRPGYAEVEARQGEPFGWREIGPGGMGKGA